MALQSWTLTQIIDQLDSGTKWNVAPGGTITWGTPTTANYYNDEKWYYEGSWYRNYEIYGLEKLNAAQTAVAARSLALWSDVANIKFEFNSSSTVKSDITFQNSTAMGDGYAWAYFPDEQNYSMKGSIWFNSNTGYKYSSELQNPSLTDINTGGWSYMAFVHEIGHALGLEHMGDYDAGNGGPITYKTHASCVQDSMLYSIMSYFTPWESKQADWQASDGKFYICQTPMMNDIAAIQKIYGANTTTRTTDTVYGFNASAGLDSVYNFNINQHPILCLFDSGGVDTLDLSGFATSSNVNLLDGEFSSCDMMTKNISIARNVIIENATTGAGNDTISGNAADNILISNAGNDVLNGLAGHDQLFGGAGNDTLSGGTGNDTLDGGSGNDAMTGGAGDDTYFIDSIRDSAVEAAGGGNDTVRSTVTLTLVANIENAVLEGNSAINATGNAEINRLTGNNAANVLSGGAGNDFLYGGGGDDRLDGGLGNDQMAGGDGNDTYVVDSIGDVVTETSGTDTVIASFNFVLGVDLENLTLTGTAQSGTGNTLNNTIIGNSAANLLYGGGGHDVLIGGTGADQLFGGAGNDVYDIDNAGDRITENSGEGTDTVTSTVTVTAIMIGDHVEAINLMGTAAINATGNAAGNIITGNANANILNGEAGNDTLNGGGGSDRLFGGADQDTLNGGLGNDLLDGGTGADIFVFSSALGRGNIDTIQNFLAAEDTIHLDDAIFRAFTPGDLSATAFLINTRALDADDRLFYNSQTGALFYDADGTGSTAAIQFAILSKNLTLTAADFVII